MASDIPQFPRIVDCFPPLRSLPGCSIRQTEKMGTSLFYNDHETSIISHLPHSIIPIVTPSTSPSPSQSDDEEIAIPSGMDPSTTQADLPTLPPPPQYWKLKKLDNSANVMDYWIKSSQEWDIDGIESDITVSLTVAI